MPINKYFQYNLDLPTHKELCPLVDVSLFNIDWGNNKTLMGMGQISLPALLEDVYKSKENSALLLPLSPEDVNFFSFFDS